MPTVSDLVEFDGLRVVLVSPRNPLNIGAAARAMSNFGVQHLRVVNPYTAAFREARSAVGASELMANAAEFDHVAVAVADCTLVVGTTAVGPREVQHPLQTLPEAGRIIRNHLPSGPVALLFGSEKRGLSTADLSYCHMLLRIPTRPDHRSMNLGQAVAVCLYEIAREVVPGQPRPDAKAVANAAETERLVTVLMDALHASGYTTSDRAPLAEEKLRRMMRRLSLNTSDAEVLLGMLRQILWRLRDGRESSSG